ncbi:carboxypeptidase regulatory-like domain-containing protein [Silvibacterium sp.]|uniref:carboxypeptidase regulatory-like domain-containing protein n=1 Tax=Silvibacterium sp. TaxID=1964179 RepID=UPI0039E5DA20
MKTLHIRRRGSLSVRALIAAIVLLGGLGAVSARAQNDGSLTGSVQDAQKAQVSDATVTVTRTETGLSQSKTTDKSGFYSFPILLPGHYDITVVKDGFDSQTKEGVEIFTGQASAVNFTLNVGHVVEKIEVHSDVAQLQSTSSSITDEVENTAITNYPLLDRTATQLQRLSGMVVSSGTGSSTEFTVAGGRGDNANYTVDGGTTQNLLQGVPEQEFNLPIDSLQEFSFSISDYKAELGRSGGGFIQMTTKSGTNNFHGSAYLYYRSQGFQAVPDFTTSNPPLQYKFFGASLGGPLWKGKTYFFFTYEGRRETTSSSLLLNVPDALERTGNFSEVAATVIDPNTGVQAVYNGQKNVLPPSELDPYGQKLASYYPLPNVAGATLNTSNFDGNDTTQTVSDIYVLRIDHKFSDRDSVYGRLLANPSHSSVPNVYPTAGTDPYGSSTLSYYYNPSATWNHTFTPNLLNEARATFSFRQALALTNGTNSAAAADLALPGINSDFFPGVTLGSFATIGNASQQQRLQTPILANEYADNLSWQIGKHQTKYGVDYRTSADGDRYSPSAGGFFTFNSTGISSNNAAGSLANLLLGRVASASRQETELLYSLAWSWGLYAQDDWHVNNRLTVNYGLRWDLDSPRYLSNNRQNSFDPTAINPVSQTPGVITFAGINGQSRYANNFDRTLFGPRFGFAYSATDKDVLRVGSGILYEGEYDQATPIVLALGFSNSISLTSPNSVAGTPAFLLKDNGTDGTGQASYPTAAQLTPSYGAVAVGATPNTTVQWIQKDHKTGYLYQLHTDWQHQLPGSTLLDIGYTGTFGHHLVSPNAEGVDQITPSNLALLAADPTAYKAQSLRPFPQFTNVQSLYPDDGQSGYNAANIQVQKRYSSGFQYQANYTWSHMRDNSAARFGVAGYPNDGFTNYYDQKGRWGLSGSDIRNRIILSGLYELPFGHGKLIHANSYIVNQVIGGWSVSGLEEVRSGTALSPIDTTNNTGSYSDGVRPNLVGNPNDLRSGRSRAAKVAEWFDTSAFAQNANYTFGNAPRTFGRGPGLADTDLTLLKTIDTVEGQKLELRMEAFNALNHANLANPNTTFGSTGFGTITGLSGGATASRTLQLAAHYTF